MKFVTKITATILALVFSLAVANAGIITGWNTDNVTTDSGPYTEGEIYQSTLYTDRTKTATNGFIGWEESDVQAPGMKVVNGDDVDGTNCIMTSGYNPGDGSDKMCSDDLKYSKRFKLKGNVNGVVDITFNVAAGSTGPYKVLHKYSDYTDVNWDEFTIELGFIVDGVFQKSVADDGLGFCDSRGRIYSSAVTSYQSKPDVLSGFFSQGLAGPADKYHPETGYFDTEERMGYGLIATEDAIVSDGITQNYLDIFGPWNTIYNVPSAYFWDDDDDPTTDDLLMANCDGKFVITDEETEEGYCAGSWVTYREFPGLDVDGLPGDATGIAIAVPADMIASWETDARFHTGPIEDLANLGLTYWIKIEDDSAFDNFTIRFTPIPVAAQGSFETCDDSIDNDGDSLIDCDDSDCAGDSSCGTPVSEICTDGFDNDGDGYADCADPGCEGIGSCGPEGRFQTCSDGLDNDGDSYIDCEDSGCAKNKSCR